jgi:putative CocE/NonD family hydrolase
MRLALAVLALVLLAPATAGAQMATTRNLEITTSDGVTLRGDLRQPVVDGTPVAPLPTVVIKFEYNKDDPARSERGAAEAFVKAGFAVLIVDSRGTGASEGEFCFLCLRDQQDGYEVVEWAAAQPWSDGNIGMFGYSEPGVEAALTATLQPPHLKAIVPAAAYADGYRDITYPGGIPASIDGVAVGLLFGVQTPNKRFNGETDPALAPALLESSLQQRRNVILDGLTRDTYDEWWQERSYFDRIDRVRAPVLNVSGWDDIYPRAASLNYLAAPSRDALLMGPWGHLGGTAGAAEEILLEASIAWFDIHLRTPPGPARQAKLAAFPRVLVFDQAPQDSTEPAFGGRARSKGTWRRLGAWLPARDERALRLCPGGSLGEGACAGEGTTPVAPVPVEATSGTSIVHDAGALGGFDDSPFHDPFDQRANVAATRFVGPVLREDMTITGSPTLRLTAQTLGTDADWVVRLVDVGPDEERLIGRGWLRASHREEDAGRPYLWHTHTAPKPVEPGVPYPLSIEIWPLSYRLPAGHRLAVLLNASDTQKVRPSGASGPSEVGAAMLTLPVRTEAGEPVEDPKAAYAAAKRATPAPVAARRACTPRRRVTVRVRLPRGRAIRRATVRVAGRRVARRVRGRTVVARVDLRGARKVRVVVRMRSRGGKRFTVRRTVRRGCVGVR